MESFDAEGAVVPEGAVAAEGEGVGGCWEKEVCIVNMKSTKKQQTSEYFFLPDSMGIALKLRKKRGNGKLQLIRLLIRETAGSNLKPPPISENRSVLIQPGPI